ncbi:MAG: tRNA (adenosine(37)-N6)-threonylcarbamoyltransferase complex ATPase subunit type 1 TsaE [Alphaproteobacteria bacterium]|nr:tRNA (adenosine(37)-N6)-threonylcarbamoyltransferase complex ATPase subunit type 1 TsaE [Alphaproteobacteria bacterium]
MADTQAIAAFFGDHVKRGDILTLSGPLGAGKSAFARAFIQHLTSPDEEVPSPTFTLVQTYETPTFEVWHFDLYRLERSEELWELGFEEAPQVGVCLIEWPERIEALRVLSRALQITLTPGDAENARILRLQGPSSWDMLLREIHTRYGGILEPL